MQLCEAVNTFQNISEPPADVLKEVKSFLSHMGQPCSTDLYSHSPQPDISLHRLTTSSGLAHHMPLYFPAFAGTNFAYPWWRDGQAEFTHVAD